METTVDDQEPAATGGLAAAPALAVSSPREAAPRTASNAPGRKPSDVKAAFGAGLGAGAKCKHCRKLVKEQQRNGTPLAAHLHNCIPAPLLVKQVTWSLCSTLNGRGRAR